ncbi:DISARM system SNF2-like helicase DrmD [Hungatella hathewayi]|uniref:DISARM system SNF2-like helicase DrmD n=1 Tax=Hungatella hathewayi TaxID=154046 RepID=UPI00210B8036|nr:DISARM system SNF2-like helicase DrmD [Hungatella hathewayi]MCQ5385854.1 DISARM system SNF2-like helicase DrmD [Hungatella hathewayi]
MESNLLLKQFSRYKKMELEALPFHFLLESNIELNPHQINAFCAAIQALKTGGIVLADEVGLGKTIEAGLVLKYVLESGAKHVLIALPASLRKQWELELEDKFGLESIILDRLTVERESQEWHKRLASNRKTRIVITSYDYSSKLMKRFPEVKWDFIIIDEAHNLRNVFHGTKRAKNLYDLSKGIPKILLTASPLQNSLTDLHGLISFIDPRIFGSEKFFNSRYIEGQDYAGLKRELSPVLYRTLRKDVVKYMNFKKRTCKTVDFILSQDEIELYQRVNDFLKRELLYSIPTSNRGLIILVIRKLLASSSFALIETFEVLKKRLEKLYEGSKSANAQEGFDLFWSFVEEEIDETGFEETNDDDTIIQKQFIQMELDEVNIIIDVAKRIKVNAKITALKSAIQIAFGYQQKQNTLQKVVIFTESKRTQKYIASELRKLGYEDEDILLFNGDSNDTMTKDIYRTWQVKNFGKVSYGRSVEYKHAIVDYFHHNAKILICTDTGSEGLNLQFCNTVINYDLPWNPMKIEQRIGRCHRYGQEHDVIAINLLNTQNAADQRVYDILSKKFELFEGVFGASDIALGALESGLSFEKMVLQIYQTCDTTVEFKRAFDKLDRKLNAKRDKKVRELRSLLLSESSGAVEQALDSIKSDIARYLHDVEYWSNFNEAEVDDNLHYLEVNNWGETVLSSHGTLFIGSFCDSSKLLFPILLLCDESGDYIDFNEAELIPALEKIDDMDVRYFTPTELEMELYQRIFDNLTSHMLECYQAQFEPIKAYNRRKIENWERIQIEQLITSYQEMGAEIVALKELERRTNNFYEKIDIRKKITEKSKTLERLQASFHEKVTGFKTEGEREIAEFNTQFDIDPILLVNIVLKF